MNQSDVVDLTEPNKVRLKAIWFVRIFKSDLAVSPDAMFVDTVDIHSVFLFLSPSVKQLFSRLYVVQTYDFAKGPDITLR